MSDILRFLGIALVLASSAVFSAEYKKHLDRRMAVCEGFSLLLTHIRTRIDCYLTPAASLLSGFENSVLEACGYIEEAKKNGIATAYFLMENRLGLPKEVRVILSDFFSSFGKEYKEGTIRELSTVISVMDGLISREREECEKSLKIARILAVSAALAVAILII